MKKISVILALILCMSMLAGCAGTPVVYYTNCTCPVEAHQEAQVAAPAETAAPVQAELAEGELKTGLALVTDVSGSKSAAEEDGEAKYDVTIVAVTVDANGVIRDCIIDGIAASVTFDSNGAITTDMTKSIQTKNELGENYGMVAWGGAIAEWDEQAAALAAFAVGKTVEELRGGAIDDTGRAPEGSDLASSATIYLGGYVSAIEDAVANAQNLGAQTGDQLKLAVMPSNGSSTSAEGLEKDGNAQLDVDVAVVTMKDGTITSCMIDSVQAKVGFDHNGSISSDLTIPVQTKNQLGTNYGMVAYAGAVAEWNEQAASFAAYVTGKTPAEVAGIAVNERTVPTEADLTTSVTIAIGGFQALIAKAAQ